MIISFTGASILPHIVFMPIMVETKAAFINLPIFEVWESCAKADIHFHELTSIIDKLLLRITPVA